MKPIFITGAARSGTSMTAGIFSLCGAFGGSMGHPSPSNRKGNFENMELRAYVERPYFSKLGVDVLGQNPLPDPKKLLPMPELRFVVHRILQHQGWNGEQVWFHKEAKKCLVWPLWADAFPEARWIIVRRSDADIAASCLRTGFMRAFDTAEGWLGWVAEHKRRFEEMKAAGLALREVWPAKFIRGQFGEVRAAVEWCGLHWNEKAVLDFVEPALWSTKKEAPNGSTACS